MAPGFPSPAEDDIEPSLDVQALLVRHPTATYFFRAAGRSMEPVIHDGDILVVDRSITPVDGVIVVAAVLGEYTVKTLVKKSGVVTHSIRAHLAQAAHSPRLAKA